MALFDYDPLTMSPNPDAAEEELPFKEGQIIKVGAWLGVMARARWGGGKGEGWGGALARPKFLHTSHDKLLSFAFDVQPSSQQRRGA